MVSECLTYWTLTSIQRDSGTWCQESAMGSPLLVNFGRGRLSLQNQPTAITQQLKSSASYT